MKGTAEQIERRREAEERLRAMSPEQKFYVLDDLFAKKNPEFAHRPAANVVEFVESPFYMGLKWGDKGGAWPATVKTLKEFYSSGKHEACFEMSIGAGKSYMSSLISAYELHKLLCLRDPHAFFRLSKDSLIAVVNMSVTAGNAADIVFGELKARIDNSFWYQHFGQYDPKKTSELEFPGRIFCIPCNSKETSVLGYSVICGIQDEANFYHVAELKSDAKKNYYAMKRRILSRFGSYGRLVVVSSTNTVEDFTAFLEHDKDVFHVKHCLWDVNPKYETEPMEKVDGHRLPSSMVNDYRKNPEQFKRDFMCIPSQALEPYFKDTHSINTSCIGENLWSDGRVTDGAAFGPQERFIHIDLGLKKDAAALACGYRNGANLVIDLLARVKAQPGGEVNFQSMRDIVYAVQNAGGNVGSVTLDGWQSADSLQQFRSRGIACDVLSVDRDLEPYDTLKGFMYTQAALLPDDEVLKTELMRLELLKGKKVDHPRHGSKDCADACAGVAYAAAKLQYARVHRIGGRKAAERVDDGKATTDDQYARNQAAQIRRQLGLK